MYSLTFAGSGFSTSGRSADFLCAIFEILNIHHIIQLIHSSISPHIKQTEARTCQKKGMFPSTCSLSHHFVLLSHPLTYACKPATNTRTGMGAHTHTRTGPHTHTQFSILLPHKLFNEAQLYVPHLTT